MRQISSRAHPGMLAGRILTVQRASNREQSLRISRLLGLIHRARFQRHRYRIRFVRTRIVEPAIDQDRNRYQRPLPAAAKLQNSYCSRLFTIFRLLVFLGLVFLRDDLRSLGLPLALHSN